jgi:valyl-tRNA synthetase
MWCCSKAEWGADFKWSPSELDAGAKWITKIANGCRLLELRKPSAQALSQSGPIELAAWPEPIGAACGLFEQNMEAELGAMRIEQATLRLREFGRQTWCEGWLGPNSKSWEEHPEAWRQALISTRRLLAIAHPFAPAATWWLNRRLAMLSSS